MGHCTKLHVRRRWRVWLVLLQCFLLLACAQEHTARTVKNIKVAVLPDQNESILRTKYQPLLNEISIHTGLMTTLLIPESYSELLDWFDNKQVDLALFGGVTYVKAHLKNKAVPLVMRDVDGHFRSVVLVHVNNSAKNIQALKGATLAFGSKLSTSGHFMPRHFLQQ